MIKQIVAMAFCFLLVGCGTETKIDQKAYQDSISRLLNAKTIKCYWKKGVLGEYKRGNINIESTRYSTDKSQASSVYDNIDIVNKKARMIGSSGTGDEEIITTESSVTFIDRDISGIIDKVSMTTIFPDNHNANSYVCVMSFHTVVMNTPIPQQYYGTAQILQE